VKQIRVATYRRSKGPQRAAEKEKKNMVYPEWSFGSRDIEQLAQEAGLKFSPGEIFNDCILDLVATNEYEISQAMAEAGRGAIISLLSENRESLQQEIDEQKAVEST
jgi:hypothetical protein